MVQSELLMMLSEGIASEEVHDDWETFKLPVVLHIQGERFKIHRLGTFSTTLQRRPFAVFDHVDRGARYAFCIHVHVLG